MTCHRVGSVIVCGRAAGRKPRRERPPCRWPADCARYATQASWGCQPHFFKLSPDLRRRLWQAERDERAANGRLGPAWAAADSEARAWVAEQLAKPAVRPDRRQPELEL